jgi:hypothetical protein
MEKGFLSAYRHAAFFCNFNIQGIKKLIDRLDFHHGNGDLNVEFFFQARDYGDKLHGVYVDLLAKIAGWIKGRGVLAYFFLEYVEYLFLLFLIHSAAPSVYAPSQIPRRGTFRVASIFHWKLFNKLCNTSAFFFNERVNINDPGLPWLIMRGSFSVLHNVLD